MKACRRASPVVTLPMSTMQFLQLNYNEKKKKKTVLNFTSEVGKAIKWFLHLSVYVILQKVSLVVHAVMLCSL